MIRRYVFAVSCLLAGFAPTWAQTVTVDMNDASAWTIVQDEDAAAEFGFDYSIYGVPPAPNGSDSLGIRLAANLADPAESAAISVSPKDLSFSGRYRVEVDAWLNFYGDPEGNGTTEFAGVFVAFDPSGDPINGAGLIGSTDGDAAEDYRLYVEGTQLTIDSGQYFVASLNNTDQDFVDAFPSEDPPFEQLDNFDPPNEEPAPFDGRLAFAWRRFAVEVDNQSARYFIDDLEVGFVESALNDIQLSGGIGLTLWDIFSSVAPEPEFAFTIYDNLSIELLGGPGLPGDFDGNGILDAADIDLLSAEIRAGGQDSKFDVNADGRIDMGDHTFWVKDLKSTWIGDADLDGEFGSGDLVAVLSSGSYEAELDSGWATGDFDASGRTNTSDLVAALQDGGYELGPRPAVAVPEPAAWGLAAAGLLGPLVVRHRRRR